MRRGARVIGLALADEGANEIARRARGTPRIAGRLLRRVRDFAVVEKAKVVTRTIAAALSEPRDAIEEIIEPYLIQQGLVQRTPRGRLLTPHAFRHLGLAEPPREAAAPSLFDEE